MNARRSLEVLAGWHTLKAPAVVGVLHATPTRGKEVFSFEFSPEWLRHDGALTLDPTLTLYGGPQYPAAEREIWGVFSDSAPDRWGRVLMQRREAITAREEQRPVRRLTELDFLLGVYDGHRLGGLRYRFAGGPFLDDNEDMASPPWTSLAELEQVSLRLERDDADRSPEYSRWLRMLVAPGRSLGGARPKASVVDSSNDLWIAKFPSATDSYDVGAWEGVASVLAQKAGIAVSTVHARRFGSRHHTFLSKRFDRVGTDRVHFASAMTMLNQVDGVEGASYIDIARVLMQSGANPNADLEQLWRRIVFNACISNVDDHLRNHGFLLRVHGWELAPAYDMNPVAEGTGLALNISETDNSQNLDLLRAVAKHFRVGPKRAHSIIDEVVTAVREWDAVAQSFGIPREERERMSPAFRLAD